MSKADLTAVRLKVARAKKKLDALSAEIAAYLDPPPYRIGVEAHGHDQAVVCRIERPPDPDPLTYRDRMAARYGKKRWVRGEGAHGVLKSHYKLNARRRYRSKAAVELETNIVFAIMLSLAIQQREHERTNAPPGPVPAPAVAPLPLAA